ncbi:Phosphate transporter PHO1-like protein 3 [Forsythia ovata]|uniref:Phosphate transporter PHO1-like protein 3 n=1 Tax=Forsythia ovata TaxID=205694 RepID=A0ABD1WD23_9LAMI
MKFGKEFVSQMVPEWNDAYMDYNFLKTVLKEIQVFKQRNNSNIQKNGSMKKNLTLHRAFSGLTTRRSNSPKPQTPSDIENQVILVNEVRRNGEEGSETMFLNAADEGGEYELIYFKRLDSEFNKVRKFYKFKVAEVMKEATDLNKQMEALIAFRIKVENPEGWLNSLEETTHLALDVAASRAAITASTPSAARASSRQRSRKCLRRLYDEKDAIQGFNGLKYFSIILAVSTRTAYTLNRGVVWKYIAWIASAIATIFCTYWDIVIDWGLLQRNSKNYLLRDKLLVPHKSVYFVAMVLNVLLRLAWIQTVMNVTIFSLHGQTVIALVAALEIIRRGIWNFFRLENEHLNNVGKYRAFKSVPLPFNYDDDEDKEE